MCLAWCLREAHSVALLTILQDYPGAHWVIEGHECGVRRYACPQCGFGGQSTRLRSLASSNRRVNIQARAQKLLLLPQVRLIYRYVSMRQARYIYSMNSTAQAPDVKPVQDLPVSGIHLCGTVLKDVACRLTGALSLSIIMLVSSVPSLPSASLCILSAGALLTAYFLWRFAWVVLQLHTSSMRDLPGPSSPSWFYGNLAEIAFAEARSLHEKWTELYGHTMTYRGMWNVIGVSVGFAEVNADDSLVTDPVHHRHTSYQSHPRTFRGLLEAEVCSDRAS